VSECTQSCLRIRRDSSRNELICIRVGQLFNKSNRFPILHSRKIQRNSTDRPNQGAARQDSSRGYPGAFFCAILQGREPLSFGLR
jgi:hypothetical protein